MKSRALGHKSDKSCNHKKDLFLLWAFLLFQGCKLSYWWYLGWTHGSLKECILLHFHGKDVQMLWSSLFAAGCGAGPWSILFRVVAAAFGQQLWQTHLLPVARAPEAPGSGRSTSALVTFGRIGTGIGVPGWGGMAPVPDRDPFPKLAPCGQTGRVTAAVAAVPWPLLTSHCSPAS